MELLNCYFTPDEIASMRPIANTCPHCTSLCGTVFRLNCGCEMCGQCLDRYYDESKCYDYLFDCPNCQQPVQDYTSLEQ